MTLDVCPNIVYSIIALIGVYIICKTIVVVTKVLHNQEKK